MFTVEFHYRPQRGQRRDRYPEATETVTVDETEIDAMRGQDGVPSTADREQLARYVAYEKRASRAFGRACEVATREHPKLAKVA